MMPDRRIWNRVRFAQLGRLSLLLLLSLMLVGCGSRPAPLTATAPTGTSAAVGGAQFPTTNTEGSPIPAPAATAVTPSAASTPSPASTASPAAADAAQAMPEIAITRPDKTVVLAYAGAQHPITKLNHSPKCGDLGWSPDGYRLAAEGGVYTFGADASEPPALAPIAWLSFGWSPDGKRLAWLAGVDEHLDVIRVGGPDGDDATVIGGGHWGYTGMIEWSPDGRTILSSQLEAAADGSGFKIVAGRGRNPTWSADGSRLAWTMLDANGAQSTLSVMEEQDGAQKTLATIPIALTAESAAMPMDLERLRLHWLPDNRTLLVSVPTDGLVSGGGTYLLREAEVQLLSPHVLCDLAPDGLRMVARTADQQIVVVRLADGAVEAELGPGLDAAWRPHRRGAAPTAPLAAKSPTLSLTSPPQASAAVNELQQRLAEQGYDVGPIDGIFGPRTEQAVRAFQRQQGLEEDGLVGARTWAALRLDAVRTTKQFFDSR